MPNATNTPRFLGVLLSEWQPQIAIDFVNNYWISASYKIVAAYVLLVFGLQKAMKGREAFALNKPLVVWNFIFALYSMVSLVKLFPEFIAAIGEYGVTGSYCHGVETFFNESTGYWGFLFAMSKIAELGDTLFLILRKRPVLFLHWYHHAVTLLYAQTSFPTMQAWFRWCVILNLAVHSVMYTYFGLRAMKIDTPLYIPRFITGFQITQFVVLFLILAHLGIIILSGSVPDCQVSGRVILLGGLMYMSYIVIFGAFFYRRYVYNRTKITVARKATKSTKAE